MQTRYTDLIHQTFDFPQKEFEIVGGELFFHEIDLMGLIREHGTPLKFTYLPKIGENIKKAKRWFKSAMDKYEYKGKYHYCYCTKSSHFSHVVSEALRNGTHIETSSAYDIEIVKRLIGKKSITKDHFIICNGYKDDLYLKNIVELVELGFDNTIIVLDNDEELDKLQNLTDKHVNVGIRIASEEEPKFPFYTSRLGIGYKSIVDFYRDQIEGNPKCTLKLLHFFINTGINDSAYYWNELTKCLRVFCQLKKACNSLKHLDIGGGFPVKNSLGFDFDYKYMVDEIINQILTACREQKVEEPDIMTEFGTFTVGEAGGVIYEILSQKKQNDREKWNMINSSFITTLPDSWAINKRFIMLPINRWEDKYERVLLGGITCDSDDYYNSEQHVNAIYLPYFAEDKPLYIGFFNVGAYQENIGGHGGIHHCLIPQPKHVIIDANDNVTVFCERQTSDQVMNLLGY